jgi:hypothetical protein
MLLSQRHLHSQGIAMNHSTPDFQPQISTDVEQQLEAIASTYLGRETLQRRRSDSLDFFDCSVWMLRAALAAAYAAGQADAKAQRRGSATVKQKAK